MPTGTNTSTGSRTSTNPYIQKLQNLGSRNETPERFLQQKNDPSRSLRISQEAANQDSLSQSHLGNQNQDTAYHRSKNANIDAASLAEQSKQNDFGRRMQEKEWDAKQASKTITFTNTVDNSVQNDFNRQKELMQMQSQQEMAKTDRDRQNQQTMQAAQLAAQERLARIQQQTTVLSGNPGESSWRWF
jgi:hypothetical protein